MRRINCFIILFLSVISVSCYKDQSTEASFTIPDIKISAPDSVLDVYYGEELKIAPVISQEGRSESDFTYDWKMDMVVGSTKNMLELGDGPTLTYTVANTPSTLPYSIILTVTDKQTGLSKSFVWAVYVNSSLGEGLLVAHSRDGGKTTDLDLVSDTPVTYGYSGAEPRYTRNLYSLANGSKIEGKVLACCQRVSSDGAVYNVNDIAVGTENSIFTVDPLTFKFSKSNSSLFDLVSESSFKTSDIFNFADYVNCAVVNGKFYGMLCLNTSSYTKATYNTAGSDNIQPGTYAYWKDDQGAIAHFNSSSHSFFVMSGWLMASGSFSEYIPSVSFPLSTSTCLGAGCTRNGNLGFVMKDGNGGHHVVVINTRGMEYAFTEYSINAPEIDNAKSITFCDNCDVIYYATASTVYAIVLSGGTATVRKLSWQPDSASEGITSIKQYSQGWYGMQQLSMNAYEFAIPTHRLQIMITTWNPEEGEGKIYLRPFNVSTGLFTYKSNGTYGGFGEISAVASTLR